MPQLTTPLPIDPQRDQDSAAVTEDALATKVLATLHLERDWPFPLHSPLPPSSLDGDQPTGLGARDLPKRFTVTLLALAGAARPAKATAKSDWDDEARIVGLPTAEVLYSVQEWFDRKPGLNAPQGPIRHRAMLLAIRKLDLAADYKRENAAPEWLSAMDKAIPRQAEKSRLKQASARIFSPEGGDLEGSAAGGTQPITTPSEQAQVAAVLQQPAGAARLMARIFDKAVRAHLGRPAVARRSDEDGLVSCALGLLPAVLLHGELQQQLAAATVLRGLPPRAQPLADAGLPRCFQVQMLQSPAQLAAQARFALGGGRAGGAPAADGATPADPLPALLDTVLALARDLVRIATDPLRAQALGFDAAQFRQWANRLGDDMRESRLPARLHAVGDESTAAYLTMDLLPRLHRWKSHHSKMAGPEANARSGAAGAACGYAQALQAAADQTDYRPALPTVLMQHGRPQTG